VALSAASAGLFGAGTGPGALSTERHYREIRRPAIGKPFPLPATSTRLACQLAQKPGALLRPAGRFIGSFWPSVSRTDVALFQHFAGGS
jgi:hypothetical protein